MLRPSSRSTQSKKAKKFNKDANFSYIFWKVPSLALTPLVRCSAPKAPDDGS